MGLSIDLTPDDNDTNNLVGSNDGSGGYGLPIQKIPEINGLPRVTLSDKDRAAIAGAAFGPAGMAVGYHYGDKIGNWSENAWNSLTGKNARDANERAARDAENLRRDNVTREYEARNQADGLSYGAAMNRRSGSNKSVGVVGAGGDGTIGSNISTSGTF